MTPELEQQLRALLAAPPLPAAFGAGQYVIALANGSNLGRPCYQLAARRGGFSLGHLAWSNQWNAYAWRGLPDDTPIDQRIAGEIYVILRDLNKREGVGVAYEGWRPGRRA